MTNGDILLDALEELLHSDKPVTSELAMKMLSNPAYRIGVLGFMTRLIQRCPSIIDEIESQIKMGVV